MESGTKPQEGSKGNEGSGVKRRDFLRKAGSAAAATGLAAGGIERTFGFDAIRKALSGGAGPERDAGDGAGSTNTRTPHVSPSSTESSGVPSPTDGSRTEREERSSPTPESTDSASETETDTPGNTKVPTETPEQTDTPTPTEMPTSTRTPTATPTDTPTRTPTETPTPTATPTPTPDPESMTPEKKMEVLEEVWNENTLRRPDYDEESEEFLLDLRFGKNTEVREEADRLGVVLEEESGADEPIDLDSVNTDRGTDIYEVDPLVHNLWRWNDYAIINNGVSGWDVDDGEVDKFLSGIDDPDKWRDVKNKPERAVFPNYESDDTWRRGEFDFEEYSSADDLGEFLDWHMPLRIEYESQLDDGNSSDEMAKFGVIAERAAEEFADIDATFVPIKVPVAGGGSTYDGMGIAVDHTNEEVYLHGSDSFGVKTSEGGEDYHKLDELMDGEEPSEVWMPFGYARGENADEWGIGPNEAKSAATEIISSLAVGYDAGDLDTGSSSDGVAFTDEYLESRMDKLENYDEEEFSIHRLMNEAEVAVSLLNKDDKTFAMDVDENGEMYAAKVTPKTAEKVYKGEINDVRGYIQDKETAGSLSGPVDTLKSTAEGVYSSVRDFAS